MDDYSITGYGLTPQPQQSPIPLPLLDDAIAIGSILCLVFAALAVFGYGTVHMYGLPAGATLRINRHIVTAQTLTLRPGTYQAVITSPFTDPVITTIQVRMFGTTNVSPTFTSRNPDAVAGSVIGAVNAAIPVHMQQAKWFASGTWLAGFLIPGNPKIALHYDATKGQWAVAYYDMDGYPHDTSALPADVAAYIKQLGVQYRAS